MSLPNQLDGDERRRHGLALLAQHSITEVALRVGVSRRTVLRWKAGPRPRRGPGPGRPRTWTAEHVKTLLVRFDRIPADERTTERLVGVLQRITGHERTADAAAKLLRRAGLRLGRPQRHGDESVAPGLWHRAVQGSRPQLNPRQ